MSHRHRHSCCKNDCCCKPVSCCENRCDNSFGNSCGSGNSIWLILLLLGCGGIGGSCGGRGGFGGFGF
jgi:hypothetical protein